MASPRTARPSWSERLRAARRRKRLSVQALAKLTGVPETTITKLESGLPGIPGTSLVEALHTIALALDLDRVAIDAILLSMNADPGVQPASESTAGGPISTTGEEEFARRLIACLEESPVEDGYAHAAEALIQTALEIDPPAAARSIEGAYRRTATTRPALAADLIRCIGGLAPSLTEPWRWILASRALAHPGVAVRDAAAGALEHWGGEEALRLLREHVGGEQVPWLAAYMQRVIADLDGAA